MSFASATHAALSVADLFTIGIGPSSSHTVGPMRAAASFAEAALRDGRPLRISCELFGSLALTGRGHATDVAVLLGLCGWLPEQVEPNDVPGLVAAIREHGRLRVGGVLEVAFVEAENLVFHWGEFLPGHANAMRFKAEYDDGRLFEQVYFSTGGGAIALDGAPQRLVNVAVRYPFSSGRNLLEIGNFYSLTIAEIVWANEKAWRSHEETLGFIDSVRAAMLACVDRGCLHDGVLPGGLKVQRRAKALHQSLIGRDIAADPSLIFEG